MVETKQCYCCGEVKPLSEFHKNKAAKDGLHSYCKSCVKASNKAYREANPDWRAWDAIKTRAKKKGLGFDIEVADVVPPEFCPILGLRLERGKGCGGKQNSPSVDRIDPTKGYVKDNIQVISNLANLMKSDATPEQLLMFADWIYKTYKEKQYG
jgi:hypothetical protein